MSTPDPSMISAAEYARRHGMSPSAMSRLMGRGLPFVEGRDAHGRWCKFIEPEAADRWRTANCTPKVDGNGRLRGVPVSPAPPPEPASADEPTPPQPEKPPGIFKGPGKVKGGIEARIQEARAIQAEEEAKSRRLKRLELQGRLADRAKTREMLEGFSAGVSTILERKSAEAAADLAATLGCTPHAAFLALRKVMDDLGADFHKLVARGSGGLDGV